MAQLTLFELNNLIKSQLENNLEPNYWVVAEISELRVNQKGHCYMELVEKENNFIQAKMRANIWSYTYRSLSAQFENATGTSLKPGIKVLFNLSVNFHEVYGLSLTVNDIDPNYTIGERSRLREETIQRLQQEELFDKNKKLELPIVPQNIAVISSDSAAGYGDFIDQLRNNGSYYFQTILFPAMMQGNEAVVSIRKALKDIHESQTNFDAVVIIRGGGAQADLDCFDTYELARAISLFPLPLLTGIGHERDQTVADLVAHTSLKTPTAVAEFLISGMNRFDDLLHEYLYRIEKVFENKLTFEQRQLQYLSSSIEQATKETLKSYDHALGQKALTLKYVSQRFLERQHSLVDRLDQQLTLIDPMTILKRGYSLTLKNGKSVMNQKLEVGDLLETRTLNKNINSQVTAIKDE
ncbi:exodeoxyribonuclease VII large subunit [Roseivirga sp. E12]|uniref:exodeoxyribonuclease VII large subunit n=1 Tax=Roseivirga sp. E12 TaxID=2819237 RepID=UPI001ABCD9B9|nr:exodeoxyribonuclease VII large subunit [Roseivirga sp. E12]MBO3698412.1 exodeoxyribonuclease VII large subunit [Roseivirga sp. E12]